MNKAMNHGIVYGPLLKSRRLGVSLGINLMPSTYKLCPFDCIYCHCGWTKEKTLNITAKTPGIPGKDKVLYEVEKKLAELSATDINLDFITFSGDGEASLHPNFADIVRRVKKLRDRYFSKSLVAILSNSASLIDHEKWGTFELLDRRFMKLDAGTEEMLQLVNRPAPGVKLCDIVKGLQGLRQRCDFVVQVNFFSGRISNAEKKHLEQWLANIALINPGKIAVYSICRHTPDIEIEGIPDDELTNIARHIQDRTGIKTVPFYSDRDKNKSNRKELKKNE